MFSDKKKDFTYSRIRRAPFFEMKEEHYHPYHEIYYLRSGTRKFFINDSVYSVKNGDMILIPKSEIHKATYFSTDEEHERITITFTDHFLEKLYQDLPGEEIANCLSKHQMTIPLDKRAYVDDLFQRIADEYALNDSYSNVILERLVSELLIFLLRQEKNLKTEKAIEESDSTMEEAAQYIYSNYEKELSLEEIALRFHMSSSYFSRKFKSVTGFGFKEYVNALRLREARKLLTETSMSVTDIAMKCGFENSNYFGDVFKKIEGESPREYRKRKKYE